MSKTIVVGMAELNTARDGDILITLGLGSCVGVTLYDAAMRIGGMVHVMLPDSTVHAAAGPLNQAKFADTGIPLLVDRMVAMGARRGGIVAKIAGGANMFSSTKSTDVLKVGARNAQASREALAKLRIPLKADDTGGGHGRTISINTQNGDLLVRTIGHGEKII